MLAAGHDSVLFAQYTPIRAGKRPVSRPARAGVQTGEALYLVSGEDQNAQ